MGKLGETKTPGSKAWVAVPEFVADEIEQWRLETSDDPQEFMFANSKRTPLRLDVWFRYVLKPIAKDAGIGNVNAQMLRRTLATLAHAQGVRAKSVQKQLRHASILTTLDIYTQGIDANIAKELDDLAKEIMEQEKKED